MSTIYLDPVTMDATAGAIGGHAREVENVVGDLETACSAYVPPHLAGWLAEELHDIALTARLSALLYTVAALDTALRAQQISADQSLATAWPALDAPFGDLTTTPFGLQAALAGTAVVGGTGPGFTNDFAGPEVSVVGGTGPAFTNDFGGLGTSVVGGTPDLTKTWIGGLSTMTLAPIDIESFAFLRNPSNQADAAALLKLIGLPGDLNATTLAPNGTIYAGDGQYEGSDGRRGTYSQIYEIPGRPGEHEVRP
jgi:hypothetical protein